MKRLIILFIGLHTCLLLLAASVDTVVVHSRSMNKSLKCVVIKPDNYKQNNLRFPVVYLLHGYEDSYNYWIKEIPSIRNGADENQMILVCPDGSQDSWYFDSPRDSTVKIETHISKEVVEYIDATYRTIADRSHRAITGMSMGGHGAIYIALRHTNIFGAAGSTSGVLNIIAFRDNPGLQKHIGDEVTYKAMWDSLTVIKMIEYYPADSLALIIDCGIDDPFYRMNKRVHEKMLQLKIPHEFIEGPGAHTNEYWTNAIKYQLLFFHRYFRTHMK